MFPIWLIMNIFSTLIWQLPPIRQYKTQYFFFFLVLALGDLSAAVLVLAFHISSFFIYPVSFLLLITTFINNRKIKTALLLLIVPFWVLMALIKIPYTVLYLILISQLLIIILYVVREFYKRIILHRTLNWFLLFLLIYLISNVLKTLAFIINTMPIEVSSFLQIMFGILFCFITVDNSNWKIKPPETR